MTKFDGTPVEVDVRSCYICGKSRIQVNRAGIKLLDSIWFRRPF